MKYDVIVVGSGFAGSVLARKFADDNKKVLIYEKRPHIAGNMYEETINGIRVHKYGPHIFHTNNAKVMDFLKQYGQWYFYEHKVLGKINNVLVKRYKGLPKVYILDLINEKDPVIKKFGKFVYKNVFENYTAKQWNIPISEIDKSVINRVPVILGYDDRYFQDKYQYMPKLGYTKLFEQLLDSKNITIKLATDALQDITIDNNKIYVKNKEFNGIVIYTGEIDELFNYRFNALPYRSLDLVFENCNMSYYQPSAVVNYPNEEKYTRITEFKYFSNQLIDNNTIILKEYSKKYDYKDVKCIPYYAIISDENIQQYNKIMNWLKVYLIYICVVD